jgi:hypothetical protein
VRWKQAAGRYGEGVLPSLVTAAALVATLLVAAPGAVASTGSEELVRTLHPLVVGDDSGPDAPRTTRISPRVPVRHRVTYDVETRGRIVVDLGVFRRQVQATFDDRRGWRGSGIVFRRVARGGDFTVVLSAASRVTSFSSGCSSEWSCRVGRFVVINQLRWRTASPAWNAADRSRRSYRHMVVNHETGHWLGHGHRSCPGEGRAPLMQQQSKGLEGCTANPWPTAAERRVPRFD